MSRRLSLLLLVVAALAIAPSVALHADDGAHEEEGLDNDSDHDRARDLLEHGEINPLSEIIAHVASAYPGEVVAVALARKQERWVYRFKILTADGRLRTLSVDAKSMDVVHEEGGD